MTLALLRFAPSCSRPLAAAFGVLSTVWAATPAVRAQTPPPPAAAASAPAPADLAETVVFVSVPQFPIDAQLETTVYTPSTPGPWPLVVINHGSLGLANPHQQDRNRPVETARFFLDRGYLVVAPMREGFSKSTGTYSWSCDYVRYSKRYAQDISATIAHFLKQGNVRRDAILVAGQSNGGMVTLGYGASQPQARAILNFAGGINSSRPECDWPTEMVRAARELGAQTTVPALWIYTETDTIFPPSISKPFFEAYASGGAPATFKLFPRGGHAFSTTRSGRETWGPTVEGFLRQVGLPAEVLPPAAAQ